MIYLLDAYNIMYDLGMVKDFPETEQRHNAFIGSIAGLPGKKKDRFIIVFDGQERSRTRIRGIDIYYSDTSNAKADGILKELSERYEGSEVTVVTKDRAVADYVRRGRHQVMSPQEFIKQKSAALRESGEQERIRSLQDAYPDEYWSEMFK